MSPREPWALRRAFRLPRAAQLDRQLDDELRFHLDERVDELVAAGLSRAEAEREALERFGDVERWRRDTRLVDRHLLRMERRMDLLDTLRRETRHALRALGRAPGFALIALVTLALGIGATTAIFTVLDAVALRPLPYPAADRLAVVQHAVPLVGARDRWALATVNYFDFLQHVPALEAIGIYTTGAVNMAGPGGGAERARSARVSASLFPTLGARAQLGRLLDEADNAPGAEPVVVLGHDLWQRRFGGDRAVVGRTIDVDARQVRVVGVAAPGLHLPDARVDVWVPEWLDPTRIVNQHTYQGLVRLRPGATPEVLTRQLVERERLFPELYPDAYSADFFRSTGFTPVVTPLREHVVGDVARTLWILLAAVGLVLVIACAHVANLFLVRMEARRRELAVRAALGASRAHLAWQLLTESLLLTVAAALVGLALAAAAVRVLVAVAPAGLPRLDEIGVGLPHAAFALGVAVVIGAVFGLLPVLRGGVDVATLREGARGLTASRPRQLVRSALVVGQVALSLVLLAAGGLMLRSAQRLRAVPPGFDPANVVTFQVPLPYATYEWGDYERVAALHHEIQRRLGDVAGVQAVGGVGVLPMEGGGCSAIFLEDRAADGSVQEACLPNATVAPGYFEAMRIPLVRGAAPTWDEVLHGAAGVVVSRALAERLWPGQDPIGKGLKGNGRRPPYMRVVGVAGDVRGDGLEKPPTEIVYFPMVPNPGTYLWGAPHELAVVVRTATGDVGTVAAAARRIMADLDPGVPIDNVRTMEQVMAASLARSTLAMLLLSVAAGMALLLSAVGIYGVVSYLVGQRRGEIGIRMALGARAAQVRRGVVLGTLRLAAVGVALGLLGAVATTRVLGTLLYETSPTDPWTLALVSLLLVLLAAAASWVPAARAARVQPLEALRS